MSPLILVGLLAISSLTPSQADVKHVLEGSAHPPGCTLGDDHHHHHHHDSAGAGSTNSFGSSSHYSTSGNYGGSFGSGSTQQGAGNNNGVPGSVAFWWADANSPFKHAYEYFKKCSLKGNCLPPVAPGVQLPNNLPQNGCNGNGCTVSGSFEYKTSGSHFGPIDVKKNVFLNGQVQGVAGGAPESGIGGGCSGGNCKAESGTFHFSTSSHGNGIKGVGTGGGVGCSGNNCGSGSGELFFHGTTQGANDQNKGFGAGSGCSGSACKPGSNGQTFFHSQSTQSSFSGSGNTGGSGHINVAGNPFLNGEVNLSGNKHASFGTTSGQFDLNKNPFLSGSSQTSQTQSAYSGNGQSVSTGSDGFLGVQPHAPFGKNNDKAQPFPTAHPGASSQSFSGEYTFQSGSSGAPFPTGHPGQDGKFQNCQQAGYTCVVQEQCVNGVVSSHALAQQKNSVHYCEIGKEVCCRLPEGATSQQTGSTSSYSSFSSGSTHHTSGSFDGSLHGNGFSNLSHITAGKSSFPGSTFKFAGGAGLSPGSIQVLPVNNEAPNPLVSTAGESGSGVIHTSSPNSIKVIRNTSQNPNSANSVFPSTVDYSNDKLDQLTFISTTRGPPYLPPISSPKPPHSHTPDLSPPIISTYRPEIPTSSRPITKPVIPGVSVVTPFIPSSPKPFDFPDAQNTVPSYTPRPSIPTGSNQYLPPHTSSPTPFVTQPTQPSVSYVPSSSFSTTTRQPFTYSTSSNVNNKYVHPKPSTPKFDYSPSSTSNQFIPSSSPTPGYSYPTPSPPFDYPKPSPTPRPSSTVIITEGTKYVPPHKPSTPSYEYPKPSPTSTTKLYVPPSSPTPGYSYPTPSPPFDYPKQTQSTNVNNNYVPPKQTPPPFKVTQKPYNPPTDGYSYPTPTPSFDYPKQTQSTNVNNNYVPPKQTPRPTPPPFKYTQKPYNPPTSGYSYPTPSPSFSTPTRIPTQPTRSPNEYLPPLIGTGTNVGNKYVPPPTPTGPPYIPPPLVPSGDNPPEFRLTAGCAAALKCVQEQFCTADGFVSATPVVLTREQELARVPTTACYSKETGASGKCCRDSNYVDPWPSANLINGEDDGQYREDDSLGQYFPQKQRPARSGASSSSPNAIANGIGSPSSVSGSFGKPGGFGGQTTVSGSYGKTNGFGGQNTVSTGFGNGYNGQNTASGSFNGQSTVSAGFGKTGGFDGQQTGTGGFGGQQTSTGGFGGQQTSTGGFGGQQTGAGSFEGQTTVSGGFGKTNGFGAAGGFNGQNTASTGFTGQGSAGFGSGFTNQHSTSGGLEGQTSLSGGFGKTNGFGGQTTGSFEGSVTGGFGQTNGFGAQGSTGGAFGSQGSTSGAFGGQSSEGFGGQGSTSSGFGKTDGFGGQNTHSSSFQKTYSFQQYSNQGQGLVAAGSGTCGVRNLNTQPRGQSPIDVSFAEIPWQAMVLRDSNRSLLCGGVIVKNNAILTTAQCIEGLPTNDILIKGGEWKLGIDEEPQPFQIVSVAAAIRHPQYQPGLFQYDMALLMLEEKLRIANNVAPICLPPPNQAPVPTQQCIATGWGKRILQVHLRGAIMRSIDINIIDSNQCSETLANKFKNFVSQYSSNTICGYSNNDQCDVDYGSALACTNGDGHYSLAGIFSWDTGCKNQDQIGGYTQPDVEWIETTCSKPLSQLRTLDRQYNH